MLKSDFVLLLVFLASPGPALAECQCAPAGRLCGVAGVAGVAGVSRSRRVVGGTRARAHHLPWTALIVYREEERMKRCGGTLINDRYVLTSAACVDQAASTDVYLGR